MRTFWPVFSTGWTDLLVSLKHFEKKLARRWLSLRCIYSIDFSGSPWQQKRNSLLLIFFFSFFYSLPSLHTPHFWIQSFVSRRICFSSFASEIDLGRRQCIGIPKSVKNLSGFEWDFKTRRNPFADRIVGPLGISPAFFEAQCFTYFLLHIGNLSSGILVILRI